MGGQAGVARENQKRRTRADLLRAARQIVARGGTPSVAEVADAAGISRATAYRYFSTPEQVVREAALDAIAEDTIGFVAADHGASVEARLDGLMRRVFGMVVANEDLFRAFLAGTLTVAGKGRRSGRRLHWLGEVLEPLRADMAPEDYQRLVQSLALLAGIEALVVLRDVCDLDAGEAEQAVQWAAKVLLRGALGGGEGGRTVDGAPPGRP